MGNKGSVCQMMRVGGGAESIPYPLSLYFLWILENQQFLRFLCINYMHFKKIIIKKQLLKIYLTKQK